VITESQVGFSFHKTEPKLTSTFHIPVVEYFAQVQKTI